MAAKSLRVLPGFGLALGYTLVYLSLLILLPLGGMVLKASELGFAQIIDIATLTAGDRVVFGATVQLADADTDEERTYQIVGDLEADIKQGLIAISSPVARALIGKHEGDAIAIEAPGGTREYEIISVKYLG